VYQLKVVQIWRLVFSFLYLFPSFMAVIRLLETPLFYLNYINVTQIPFSLHETKELCLAASLLCAKKIGFEYDCIFITIMCFNLLDETKRCIHTYHKG
jgi:hypothetical protein